jgi:hypothetical protein
VVLVSINKAGFANFYGEYGSFEGSLSVTANGAAVAAEGNYILEPVDPAKAGIPFSFTATGKDTLTIGNTKSNWLAVPVDGVIFAIGK